MKLPIMLDRLLRRKKKGQFVGMENDRCVICWCQTEYGPSVPITSRRHYVDGVGQMCEACFMQTQTEETEGPFHDTAISSDEEGTAS